MTLPELLRSLLKAATGLSTAGLGACALLSLTACGGGGESAGSALALVEAERYAVAGDGPGDAPVRLAAEPRMEEVELGAERRPALVVPGGSWTWRTRVPEDGWLQVGLGTEPAWAEDDGAGASGPNDVPPPLGRPDEVEATVAVVSKGEREVLEVVRRPSGTGTAEGDGAAGGGWIDTGVDLSRFAGREVTLELSAGKEGEERRFAWAPVTVTAPRPAEAVRGGRPNILMIVVDTLRADHLGTYGYERETSPEIDRQLAGEGVVMEDAYAQAPWTLPSVVSYLTSRYPGEVLSGNPASFGIPEGVPALAEVLGDLGYVTAGFFANPVLRASNGFGRGLTTFYTPSSMDAIQLHADEINRRSLPWLKAHQEGPFFLYVHYIDPHDPYMNPDVVDGRSPYFPDPGGISGRWVHGVYSGGLPVDDLERQVRHFTALYDTEIRYVDRAIGELLESVPPEVLAETVVVLTSDHGEELYDHGFWKHGHTLYQDQIHVPLIVRWDGRIEPGRRLPGTVRLIDVAPTLVAAAGGEAPPSWQGTDLLPALTGEAPLPRLAAYAQHLQHGPRRAASILEGRKLILFNDREPFEPDDGLQQRIYEVDLARLERMELYDLEEDAAERENLFDVGAPEGGDRLDQVLQHHFQRSLDQLRVLGDALAPGAVLEGALRFEEPPGAVHPLFLGPGDRVEVDGSEVRFTLVGDPVTKGFLLPGEPGALVAADLSLDGRPLPPSRLRVGGGGTFTGARVAATALESEAVPAPGDLPGLRLWRYAGERPETRGIDPETRKSLQALGYIQ